MCIGPLRTRATEIGTVLVLSNTIKKKNYKARYTRFRRLEKRQNRKTSIRSTERKTENTRVTDFKFKFRFDTETESYRVVIAESPRGGPVDRSKSYQNATCLLSLLRGSKSERR